MNDQISPYGQRSVGSPADLHKGCLAQVEASLKPIYLALLSVSDAKPDDGGAIEQFLDGVTCAPGYGYQRGKLLRPEWRETWKQQREFSEAALCDLLDPIHMPYSAERHVAPDEEFLNKEQWGHLRDVLRKMISFVVDDLSAKPWILGELRDVLWRYLRSRRYDVPSVDSTNSPECLMTPAIYLGDGRVKVGEKQVVLENTETFVLEALTELGSASQSELAKHSGVKRAGRVLQRIATKHPLLAEHISLPGRRGAGGYSTTIQRLAQ